MKSTEINSKGNYKSWQPCLLDELKKEKPSKTLDKNLLFENEAIRIWNIVLLPSERIPFIQLNSNFSLVSMTNSMVITRSSDGRMVLHHIEKQESIFISLENSEVLYDIENVGEELLPCVFDGFKATSPDQFALDCSYH